MQVIGVGKATIDIIDYIDDFPKEDESVRSMRRIKRLGGK